jgi:hypothetical protein
MINERVGSAGGLRPGSVALKQTRHQRQIRRLARLDLSCLASALFDGAQHNAASRS